VTLGEAEVRSLLSEAGVSDEVLSKLGRSSSLLEAGVDSLDMANLLLIVEERYGLKIPDEEALQLNSVASILKLLNSKLG
jgi:acyl carrier protein